MSRSTSGGGGGGGNGRKYPDRWANYHPVGKEMTGARFVAFKCPLDPSFFAANTHPDEYFDIPRLVSYAREAQRRLGLVIDLTNTNRYYNKDRWADYDVEYLKVFVPGREVDKREDIVKNFEDQVDEFFQRNKDNDHVIGVHCTHGLNRTGYLICRYLIDRQGWTADRAISTFEECRGHRMERGEYIRALRAAEKRRDEEAENRGHRSPPTAAAAADDQKEDVREASLSAGEKKSSPVPERKPEADDVTTIPTPAQSGQI